MQVHSNPQTFTYISGRVFSQFSSVRVQDSKFLMVPFNIDKMKFRKFESLWCKIRRRLLSKERFLYHCTAESVLSSVPVMENVSPVLELGNRKRSDGALGNE